MKLFVLPCTVFLVISSNLIFCSGLLTKKWNPGPNKFSKNLQTNRGSQLFNTIGSGDTTKNNIHNNEQKNVSTRLFSSAMNRRKMVSFSVSSSICVSTGLPRRANASQKSRVDGYPVQKSPEEWKSQLTARQYEILRQGGTERPYTSILEGEERKGIYYCAGCGTALFDSKDKFHSGTGWPSFAAGLEGVEIEKVGVIQANLAGAELRCASCGGHLGDVFNDGFLFVGTRAFETGKRFCIDGAALVFRSENGDKVIGDKFPQRSYY